MRLQILDGERKGADSTTSIRVTRSETIEVNPPTNGESGRGSKSLENLLELVQKVDKAYHDLYDKHHVRYSFLIWKPVLRSFIPLFALLVLMEILYEYVLPLSTETKIALSIQLSSLAVALGALTLTMVGLLKDKMFETEEDHLFKTMSGYSPSETPVIKGLIRMRVKSRTVDLQDIHKLDPTIFELGAILKKLTG